MESHMDVFKLVFKLTRILAPSSRKESLVCSILLIVVPGASYPAFIRFSNGVGRGFTPLLQANESDAVPDIRGFGLKIFSCNKPWPGNTPSVDFQFTTSRVGFLADIPTAASFFTAVYKGNLATTAWLAENPVAAALFADQGIDGNVANLLTADWWTPVVSRFGPNQYIKSHLYPCSSDPEYLPHN